MRLGRGEDRTRLTYCMNVHPGEEWDEVFHAIRTFPPAIKKEIAADIPFGLGLRLGHRAAKALQVPGRLSALGRFLSAQGLYAFTINGFPYGKFHGGPVKAQVYRPDWSAPERRDYTLQLGRILAALLPEDCDGSISTVPLAYGARDPRAPESAEMVGNLVAVAAAWDSLYAQTGREIHLGLEPEPDCMLETTGDVLAFFRDTLLPEGVPMLAARKGCSRPAAEEILRRHIGVCVDTGHMALQFEDPANALTRLHAEGVRLSKLQLSAALKVRPGAEGLEALAAFADPVYLHQVRARHADGSVTAHGDLAPLLSSRPAPDPGGEWRVHVHIPLHFGGDILQSTATDLDARFFETARRCGAEHWEIETYTFDVLPVALKTKGLVHSVIGEYQWVLKQMKPDGKRKGKKR